jgi:hypothetical protein
MRSDEIVDEENFATLTKKNLPPMIDLRATITAASEAAWSPGVRKARETNFSAPRCYNQCKRCVRAIPSRLRGEVQG